MNISGTDPERGAGFAGAMALALVMALVMALGALVIGGYAASAESGDPSDGLSFEASGTLGADLYVIESPFDNDNVTGFFEQYRYIRDKGAQLPFFADLTHLNLGLVRPDTTYLIRAERWSRNAINENTLLDINWKGLVVNAEIRRYRSDALRFFPMGTEDDWTGMPLGLGFGTTYNPDVPGLISNFTTNIDALFASDYRIGVERFDVGGEIALRPEGFGYKNDVLKEARLRGGYGSRTGYRQDSFLLDLAEVADPTSRFRGNRRAIDQSVTNAGTGVVLALGKTIIANLEFDVDRFTEAAGVVTLGGLASAPGNGFTPNPGALPDREFFFVPDTNRYTGSLQLTGRRAGGIFNAGVFATHLEQTGRLSNLQSRFNLGLNSVTTVSAHVDGSIPLSTRLILSGFVKYIHRANNIDEDSFTALDPSGASQESPYIKKRDEIRGSMEIGAKLAPSTRIALGYTVDWVDRDLAYPQGPVGIQPNVSVIRPKSLSHRVFLKGRARLFRSLQLSGELGYLWAPEVAYPTDLSEAVSFRARGTYSLLPKVIGVPLTLSFSGRVLDGKNDEFDLPGPGPVSNGARRSKNFERTDWGYDLTLTALPRTALALYGTFSQSGDEQATDYVRTTLARSAGGGAFYVDSIPHYASNLKSVIVGGTLSDVLGADVGLSAAITWAEMMASGAQGVGSNVGQLINDANRIESRILTLNSDFDYTIREGLGAGIGYRYQEFIDDAQLGPLNLDETVHTIMLRLKVAL
jgi:hypothetical protein